MGTTADGDASRSRILAAAMRAFAERGYDGVSIRDLAREVGLTVATVQHHVGRKAELYLAVFAELQRRETEAFDAALAPLTAAALRDPDQVGPALHGVLDHYLDTLAADPDAAALWVRAWLDDPQDVSIDLWGRFAWPQYATLVTVLDTARAAGTVRPIDPMLVLRTVVWVTHGYLTGGAPGDDLLGDPRDPARLARFRAHLHDLVAGLVLDTSRPVPSGLIAQHPPA